MQILPQEENTKLTNAPRSVPIFASIALTISTCFALHILSYKNNSVLIGLIETSSGFSILLCDPYWRIHPHTPSIYLHAEQ